jgi:hypothetical protein
MTFTNTKGGLILLAVTPDIQFAGTDDGTEVYYRGGILFEVTDKVEDIVERIERAKKR